MSNSLNLTLTDELKAFIDQNCGDGALYATSTEFTRNVLQERQRFEADELQTSILEGYQDAIAGRTTEFSGGLKKDMANFKKKQQNIKF